VLYTGGRGMAVLALPWSIPALKGVGVGATPVSLYPVPIVYRTGHPGLPNTRSLCMTLQPGRCGRLRLKWDGTRAETRFHLSPKRTSPFKSAGASGQSTTGSRGVRISGSNAG
jgi:hypothetical protein